LAGQAAQSACPYFQTPMAFDLKKKGDRLAELSVPFGDEVINLKYRASKITPNYLDTQLSEVSFCADVIAEWDVTSGGEPYPPTLENLSEQGADLSYTLCYAIVNDVKTSAIQKLRV
jgi:hypothetical protein